MASFYEFMNRINEKPKEKSTMDELDDSVLKLIPTDKEALDQDTAVGDAMCEAAQLVYNCAVQIDQCIKENDQAHIDNELLHRAELALAYMQGVDFGLAMDNLVMKWYLTEMERCMASIRNSQSLAYQVGIYVPPAPAPIMGFDEANGAMENPPFLHCLSTTPPSEEYVTELKKKMVEDKSLKSLFLKGVLNPDNFPGAVAKYKELCVPVHEEKDDISEDGKTTEDSNAKETLDSSPEVNRLRTLRMQGRIGKEQYIGALATLLAAGAISKGIFTSLKSAAN